jgi:thiamine biosynthesis lipoprotein
MHHIIDPATGLPVDTPWSIVTVAAATCLEANAAATASVIMGERAPGWLERLGLPARLVGKDGAVHHSGGWPGSA